MMNRAKVFCLKLLFCVTAMTFCAATPILAEEGSAMPPILDLKPTDHDAGKTMKSTSFKSSEKKKEKEAEEAEKEDKPALEDIEEADFDESANNIAEKEKSPEQKLWDKYKDLKENAKKEAEKESEKDKGKNSKKAADEDQTDKTDLSETEEATGEKKKSTGIAGIIDDYKKSQQGKGSLNTRSFGNID
ncbi:MAG: hypothetical protein COB36_01595 [Alphaproteobacteria bacterium]|nr:MAG: hypothetical protein COB36_01595 [Alphaproteobacteria bacterium]